MQDTVPKNQNEELETTPTKSSGRVRNWLFSAAEFVSFSCLGILALEAFFNFAGVGNEEFLEPDRTLGVRHIAGKKVVWRLEGYSDEHLSKQGLRDIEHSLSKPEGTFRIALLGDSATEGMQVPLQDTYGKQLERLLNNSLNQPTDKDNVGNDEKKAIKDEHKVRNGDNKTSNETNNNKAKTSNSKYKNIEVINFGCSSYSNGQETMQLEEQASAFKPDLVIMMYNRGDYIENIRDPNTMKSEPRPYFHLDQNNELVQDNTIMEFNKSIFAPHPVLDFLRNNSRIYGVLSHTNLALSLNELLYSKMRNSILKLLPASKDQWKRVTAPYTIQDPWKVSAAILNRANADSKKVDAKFMVVCFPNNVNEKEYARQIEAIGKQSKEQGFLYADLTPDFVYNQNPKSLFLKYHFSSAGHSLAAHRVADTLLSRRDLF